jgi:ATP-dependent DNA ligase
MILASKWEGQDLKGAWHVSYKIDGVRMLRDDEGNPVSRAGKPLYNLEDVPASITDAEIYGGNWEASVSLCRSSVNGHVVPLTNVYSLDPIDPRLMCPEVLNPTAKFIIASMEAAIALGYEGLIMRRQGIWYKIKPTDTYDEPVTGIQMGKGRNLGVVGSLITAKGKVGSGLNDKLRRELLDIPMGTIIEVECMSLTPNGKFRHPRFIRVRTDKESITS